MCLRALKPSPVERVPEALPKRCELLVQVVSARNIPLRIGGHEDEKTSASRNRRSGGFGGGDDYGNESSTLLAQERDSQFLKEKKRVSTFVEVEFQGKKVRTTSVDGPAPAWKQSMSLPFMPPHGEFSHSNLEQVEDIVQFSLFDEIIHDDASRGGFLDGENTIREERRFLGSFSLPFNTILSERRIEGTFRLNTPVFNYGYKPTSSAATSHDTHQAPPSGGILGLLGFVAAPPRRRLEEPQYIDDALEKELEWCCCGDRTSTFITIMATLDPLLTASPFLDSDLSVATAYPPDRPIIPRAQMWLSKLEGIGKHTKKRKYTLFGSNSDGLSVLVCRFLKPLQPPPGMTTRRACIHFVSLIPFIPDSQAFVGEFNLWCTTKQTLEIMAGDEEEHATTLYNYLYYMSLHNKSGSAAVVPGKRDSKDQPFEGYPTHSFVAQEELFLVSGYAVPEGETTYVLIRKEGRAGENSRVKGTTAEAFLLVNPCTGYVYSAADPKCPIKEIYSLATPYNVWANIQKATSPKDLSFDIMKPSLWQPLFNNKFKPGITSISSIQSDIAYYPTPTAPCLEIEKLLKNEIISNFRKWRAKRARPDTAFHPEACVAMTDMLEWLEEWKMHGTVEGQVMGGGEKRSNSRDQTFKSHSVSNDALFAIQEKASHRLKNVTRTSTLTGYPMNMSYTDVDSIITAVRSYGVHETRHPQVQFVLAVRVFPLFNGIMSLWIFLGTLERERS
jgi:coiled-coil and C2 domain-containing protein 2A